MGLRIVLTIRSVLVATIMVFIASTQGVANGVFGLTVTSVFLITGLLYGALVIVERDRTWMRLAFVALDLGSLAVIAAAVPLSIHGDVPQIFVFRVYGGSIFFFLIASSTLSLSPRLVLWTGGMAVAALWGGMGQDRLGPGANRHMVLYQHRARR